MYWPLAADLERFYKSSLGCLVRANIRRKIKEFWPDVEKSELLTLGIGFCQPLITERASRFIAMPKQMAGDELNSGLVINESCLPFADNSIHRLIIFNTLEYTAEPVELLAEAWRVLAPEGRIIVIAPNRNSSWARSPITPFGYGTPYSKSQLTGMIEQAGFILGLVASTQFIPPSNWRSLIRLNQFLENKIFCSDKCKFMKNYGGILIAEGCKRVYSTNNGSRKMAVVFKPVRT
jgi:SAM-dependent methyltransferase